VFVGILVLRLAVHARFVVWSASILLAVAIPILTVLGHIVFFTLSADVIKHRTVRAITRMLLTHLIHIRSTVLWILLTVGIGVSVTIATVRTLPLVHLLAVLAVLPLLSMQWRVRCVVAAVL